MHSQRNAYHNYILNNNFKFYISQFFMAFNFLSVVIRFAKNQFEIVNRCHYEDEVRSNPIYVDCLTSFAMTIKNKFANLITRRLQPLVLTIQRKASKCNCRQWVKTHCFQTFLTLIKFTFDSLSRKIKSPCLVINFNFLFQGGHSNV